MKEETRKKWLATKLCEDVEHYQVKLKDEDRIRRFDQPFEKKKDYLGIVTLMSFSLIFTTFLFIGISFSKGLHERQNNREPYISPSLNSFPVFP